MKSTVKIKKYGQVTVRLLALYLVTPCLVILVLGWASIKLNLMLDGTKGPELTKQTWPAGTFLANFPEGDRINTYHRNYLMIAGQAASQTLLIRPEKSSIVLQTMVIDGGNLETCTGGNTLSPK